MRREIAMYAYIALGLLASCQPAAVKQPVPPPPVLDVVIVDVRRLLSSSVLGQRANEQFDQFRAGLQAELDREQTAVKAADKAHDPETKQKFEHLKAHFQQSEQRLAAERTASIKRLLNVIGRTITAFGKANHLALVIDAAEPLYKDVAIGDRSLACATCAACAV